MPSYNLFSTSRELTEDLEKTNLEDFFREYIIHEYLFVENINKLKNLKIETLGELLSYNTEELELNLKNFSTIREKIMHAGFVFKDDYQIFEDLSLGKDKALILIEKLPLSTKVKNIITSHGIMYLGDLVRVDYNCIRKFRGFGSKSLKILTDFIHSFGYKLLNEDSKLSKLLDASEINRKADMIQLPQDVKSKYNFRTQKTLYEEISCVNYYVMLTIGILYSNGIYTSDDLIDYGEKVFELPGMTELKKKIILDAMKANNWHFRKVISIADSSSTAPTKQKSDIEIEKMIIKVRHLEEILERLNKQGSILTTVDNELAEVLNHLNGQIDDVIQYVK